MNDEDRKIAILPGTGKRDPDAVLELAREAGLTSVLVVGWGDDGNLFMCSSAAKYREMDWLLANAKDCLWETIRRAAFEDG